MSLVGLHQPLDLLARVLEDGAQLLKHEAQGIAGEREHRDRVAGHVFGYDVAVAVVHGPTRRRHRQRPDTILVRSQRVSRVLEDLDAEKLRSQPEDQHDHRQPAGKPATAPLDVLRKRLESAHRPRMIGNIR